VDAVTLFDEDTPAELIAALVPDVLVKGGDYSPDAVVGRDVVEAAGGRLVLIPFVAGRSTTGILQRIRESEE
jgi:bifunctional ADP-heptose synthase (sugar kinase/adenylyltransferase)